MNSVVYREIVCLPKSLLHQQPSLHTRWHAKTLTMRPGETAESPRAFLLLSTQTLTFLGNNMDVSHC